MLSFCTCMQISFNTETWMWQFQICTLPCSLCPRSLLILVPKNICRMLKKFTRQLEVVYFTVFLQFLGQATSLRYTSLVQVKSPALVNFGFVKLVYWNYVFRQLMWVYWQRGFQQNLCQGYFYSQISYYRRQMYMKFFQVRVITRKLSETRMLSVQCNAYYS